MRVLRCAPNSPNIHETPSHTQLAKCSTAGIRADRQYQKFQKEARKHE